jgi:hypothetical protein
VTADMLSETQKSRLTHITRPAALSLAMVHNLMRIIDPLLINVQFSNINESYGNFPIRFGSRLMFIGIHVFGGIRIRMVELHLNMALEDGFTLSTIAVMISMTETGATTIPLAKGLGHLMK